jgi:hypothetical protein
VILAETVQRCFREAAERHRRRRLPDIEECKVIAEGISECAAWVGRVLPYTDVLGSARGSAKRLLNQLPKVRDNIHKEYLDQQALGLAPQDNRHLAGVIQIERLAKSLHELLDRYGDKPRSFTWRDLARIVAAYGTVGWRGGFAPEISPANLPPERIGDWYERWLEQDIRQQHRAPRSTDAAGPLCIFVQLVLSELGIDRETETVSAAIRGRRAPHKREK